LEKVVEVISGLIESVDHRQGVLVGVSIHGSSHFVPKVLY
jgi:hypothetical protein